MEVSELHTPQERFTIRDPSRWYAEETEVEGNWFTAVHKSH